MPTFKYKCNICGNEFKELLGEKQQFYRCPECNEPAEMQIPSGGTTVTFEMRDKNRGKQVKKGVEKQLRKRMVEHHDRYELAEKIDKHGIEAAERNGWLKKAKKL